MVVLNPFAGSGTAGHRSDEIRQELERAAGHSLSDLTFFTTKYPGHAMLLASEAAAAGFGVVAAAGGDGTLGEVANGVIGTEAVLGVLPCGSGNDFARMIGVHSDMSRAADVIINGEPITIDAGIARTSAPIGDAGEIARGAGPQGRWFLNAAGCGFDAVVGARANRGYRYLRRRTAYVAAVVQSLFTYRAENLLIKLDEQVIELRAMLCAVANARSYGGGMLIAPNADFADGLFDVCIVGPVSKLEFLRSFPHVFRGTHVSHPKVIMRRAQRVYIESNRPVPALVDGESFGTTPAEFTLHSRAIRVMAARQVVAPSNFGLPEE